MTPAHLGEQRFLTGHISQVEPVLNEVTVQHVLHPTARATIACFGIARLDDLKP